MIFQDKNNFVLSTKNTSYAFRVLDSGQLEHLHYGKKLHVNNADELKSLYEKHEFAPGNTCIYDQGHPQFSLEDMRLEISGEGKGDYREPFICLEFANGSRTTDFVFQKASVNKNKLPLKSMPASYDDDYAPQQLEVIMVEKNHKVKLHLLYTVFEERDVIAKSCIISNESDAAVKVKRLMSNQLDFFGTDKTMTTFTGS